MSNNPIQMMLEITAAPDSSCEELSTATAQLRQELLEVDVDSVEQVTSEQAAPEGARAADPVTIGALLVALSATGGVFTKVIDTIHDWVNRDEKRSVTLEVAGDKLTISGVAEADQKKLIDDWTARHKGA